MITKQDFSSSTPILNMYVRQEVTCFKISKEVVDYVLGTISNDGSKLFTTLDIVDLYQTHKILVRIPEVPLVILQYFLSFSLVSKYLAITSTLTNVSFSLDVTWVSALITYSRTSRWRQWLVKVRSWISESSTMHSRVC